MEGGTCSSAALETSHRPRMNIEVRRYRLGEQNRLQEIYVESVQRLYSKDSTREHTSASEPSCHGGQAKGGQGVMSSKQRDRAAAEKLLRQKQQHEEGRTARALKQKTWVEPRCSLAALLDA